MADRSGWSRQSRSALTESQLQLDTKPPQGFSLSTSHKTLHLHRPCWTPPPTLIPIIKYYPWQFASSGEQTSWGRPERSLAAHLQATHFSSQPPPWFCSPLTVMFGSLKIKAAFRCSGAQSQGGCTCFFFCSPGLIDSLRLFLYSPLSYWIYQKYKKKDTQKWFILLYAMQSESRVPQGKQYIRLKASCCVFCLLIKSLILHTGSESEFGHHPKGLSAWNL